MMKRWTVGEMVGERSCYSEARITELWAGRESLSLLEILQLEIPAADRLWVVWRDGALTQAQRARVLEVLVERAVRSYALPHASMRAWAERWLDGTDRTEAAASAAASDAASASSAAWAAWAAAWAAECEQQLQDVTAVLLAQDKRHE